MLVPQVVKFLAVFGGAGFDLVESVGDVRQSLADRVCWDLLLERVAELTRETVGAEIGEILAVILWVVENKIDLANS